MSRQVAAIVVGTIVTSLLFAAVSTSGGVGLWREPQWELAPRDGAEAEADAPSDTVAPPLVSEPDGEPLELPEWAAAILRVLLVALAIAATIALANAGWQRRPRVRWHRRSTGDGEFDLLPDVAAAVVDEAARQRTALEGGTPRNAIVRCWLRLEHDVAAAGLRRHPSQTSAEFTEEVLARYSVDPAAIRSLAALYREARFSRHPLDESARRAALDALDGLHRALGAAAQVAASSPSERT